MKAGSRSRSGCLTVATAPTSLRVVIADDEPLVRRGLRRLLEREPGIAIVAECGNGDEAIAAVTSERPDLLFLDVQMPGRTGIEVLAALGDETPPAVVFVTAHDRYAVEAFERHAVDYLLKPFDEQRFLVALGRARQRLAAPAGEARIERLIEALSPRPWLERIPARVGNRVTLVPVTEVRWIEAADNYVKLHTDERSFLVRDTMKELGERLDPRTFARIHRSTIVNLSAIREIRTLASGDCEVHLNGGARLSMSRGYRAVLERTLGRPLP